MYLCWGTGEQGLYLTRKIIVYLICGGFQTKTGRFGGTSCLLFSPNARSPYAAAHLANVHLVSVFARGGAICGEDSCAVAVGVPVDQADSIIQRVSLQNDQHRPKDLFRVALHLRL